MQIAVAALSTASNGSTPLRKLRLSQVGCPQILSVLNAKWFPAFSRSPVELLKTALSFSVSSRLAKYEADYKAQQAAIAPAPAAVAAQPKAAAASAGVAAR